MAGSKNGTFLFDRQYMDYHADRFADHSLMFYRDEALCALLPANELDATLYSHQGLTYGGLVTDLNMTAADVMRLFADLNGYLHSVGILPVCIDAGVWCGTDYQGVIYYNHVAAKCSLEPHQTKGNKKIAGCRCRRGG